MASADAFAVTTAIAHRELRWPVIRRSWTGTPIGPLLTFAPDPPRPHPPSPTPPGTRPWAASTDHSFAPQVKP